MTIWDVLELLLPIIRDCLEKDGKVKVRSRLLDGAFVRLAVRKELQAKGLRLFALSNAVQQVMEVLKDAKAEDIDAFLDDVAKQAA